MVKAIFERMMLHVLAVTHKMVIFVVLSLCAAVPTYFLWNWLMPTIFGIKAVTFFQMWGVHFLASILFKRLSSLENMY